MTREWVRRLTETTSGRNCQGCIEVLIQTPVAKAASIGGMELWALSPKDEMGSIKGIRLAHCSC